MENTENKSIYTQKSGSRQGEITAWGLSVVLILASIYLNSKVGISVWFLLIDAIIILSAVLISFGNYVTRSTILTLDDSGISMKNGIRTIKIEWNEVEAIQEVSSRLGPKIWLIGNEERIAFQKKSVIKWKDEIKDQIGFEQSDEIMEKIMSRLPHLEISREEYYYPKE